MDASRVFLLHLIVQRDAFAPMLALKYLCAYYLFGYVGRRRLYHRHVARAKTSRVSERLGDLTTIFTSPYVMSVSLYLGKTESAAFTCADTRARIRANARVCVPRAQHACKRV